MKKNHKPRLRQWFKGEIPDGDLTLDEILELEKLVLSAIHDKMLSKPDKIVFADHPTVQ